jgi:hypothetical protein
LVKSNDDCRADSTASSLKQETGSHSHHEEKKQLPAITAQAKNGIVYCEECELVPHPTGFRCCVCINVQRHGAVFTEQGKEVIKPLR